MIFIKRRVDPNSNHNPCPILTRPWTLLVRAEPGQIVTADLAAAAIRELEDRHMLDDDGQFMPVAEAFRRWNRP